MSRRLSLPGRRGPRKLRRASWPLVLERMEERVLLAVITVTTTGDGTTAGTTLRAAITEANTAPGSTIDFAIAASATANVISGSVSSITLTSAGGGYTTAPLVTLSAPQGSPGSQATATANISNGVITSITVNNGGSGYNTAPTVTIASGSAPFVIHPQSALPSLSAATTIDGTSESEYAGTPVIVLDGSQILGQVVSGLTVTATGSLIEGLDIVNFAAAGIDIEAANTQVLANDIGVMVSGSVSKLTLTNGGSGYSSAPTVMIAGGGGSGATATATIDSTGSVNGITLVNPGSGYTSVPTVSFVGGGGSPGGASATASLTMNAVSGGGSNNIGIMIAASTNTIGGTAPGAGNVVSGNINFGIDIDGSSGTAADNNILQGNLIGTDNTGTGGGNDGVGLALDGRVEQHGRRDRPRGRQRDLGKQRVWRHDRVRDDKRFVDRLDAQPARRQLHRHRLDRHQLANQ